MKGSRLNRLQMWNQRLLRRLLNEPKLIGSITIKSGGIIHVEKLDWEEYWDDCPSEICSRVQETPPA